MGRWRLSDHSKVILQMFSKAFLWADHDPTSSIIHCPLPIARLCPPPTTRPLLCGLPFSSLPSPSFHWCHLVQACLALCCRSAITIAFFIFSSLPSSFLAILLSHVCYAASPMLAMLLPRTWFRIPYFDCWPSIFQQYSSEYYIHFLLIVCAHIVFRVCSCNLPILKVFF